MTRQERIEELSTRIALEINTVRSEVLTYNNLINNLQETKSDKDWGYYIGATKYQNITVAIVGGDVLTYIYTPASITIYRYITTATTGLYPTEDSFYSTFDGTTLSDLITTR